MLKIYPICLKKYVLHYLNTMTMVMVFSLQRTYTMTSMSDGSSSTIMVEEWQPIFDRFDLESDGRMVSMINTIDA